MSITITDRPLQSTINNSPNICHTGQYIIIEHTKDHYYLLYYLSVHVNCKFYIEQEKKTAVAGQGRKLEAKQSGTHIAEPIPAVSLQQVCILISWPATMWGPAIVIDHVVCLSICPLVCLCVLSTRKYLQN